MIRREAARLVKYFDGIRAMDKYPGAMFVVDIKREHNAVAEARQLKIPVVAIVDTNCDPDLVDLSDRRQRRRHPFRAHDPGDHRPASSRRRAANTKPNMPAAKPRKRAKPTEKFDSAQAVEVAAGDDPATPESSPE